MRKPNPSAPAADHLAYAREQLVMAGYEIANARNVVAAGGSPERPVGAAQRYVDNVLRALRFAAGQVGA